MMFQGFPFWPGMVDYCPVEEDTFLVDPDVSTTEAAMYHVVFFDKVRVFTKINTSFSKSFFSLRSLGLFAYDY